MQGREHPYNIVTVTLSDGTRLAGELHADFMDPKINLMGTCLDLEPAYKQCPVHPADHHCAIFALKDPQTGKIEFFQMNSVPIRGDRCGPRFQQGSQSHQ